MNCSANNGAKNVGQGAAAKKSSTQVTGKEDEEQHRCPA